MCLQVRLLFLKWQGFMSISLKRDKINKKFFRCFTKTNVLRKLQIKYYLMLIHLTN